MLLNIEHPLVLKIITDFEYLNSKKFSLTG